MKFDGTLKCLAEVMKTHPSAAIYLFQTKQPDGSYVCDYLHGSPVLVIDDRKTQPGRVFEVGMEIV